MLDTIWALATSPTTASVLATVAIVTGVAGLIIGRRARREGEFEAFERIEDIGSLREHVENLNSGRSAQADGLSRRTSQVESAIRAIVTKHNNLVEALNDVKGQLGRAVDVDSANSEINKLRADVTRLDADASRDITRVSKLVDQVTRDLAKVEKALDDVKRDANGGAPTLTGGGDGARRGSRPMYAV